MMVSVPETTLQSSSSDKKMPIMGMGTAAYPFAESDETKAALLTSIKLGYRHFDTASVYHNEKTVGEAISEALKLGLAKSRDEFFVNSKLWCSDSHPDRVIPALQESLKKLGLEYLDMYLIHWPLSLKPGSYEFPIPKDEEILPMDFKGVWAAMEECQKLGLTKSIGVSNFSCKKLETILSTAKIAPVVNQVELNPLWQQTKLNEFCKDHGIVLMAFSPLGAQGSPWGTNRLMECELLHEIAKAKGKTHAQICLRWIYEQGAGILVKSYNEVRMKENLEIFDWQLSAEELKRISELPQRRGFPADSLLSAKGPFRTEEELWDGEI